MMSYIGKSLKMFLYTHSTAAPPIPSQSIQDYFQNVMKYGKPLTKVPLSPPLLHKPTSPLLNIPTPPLLHLTTSPPPHSHFTPPHTHFTPPQHTHSTPPQHTHFTPPPSTHFTPPPPIPIPLIYYLCICFQNVINYMGKPSFTLSQPTPPDLIPSDSLWTSVFRTL